MKLSDFGVRWDIRGGIISSRQSGPLPVISSEAKRFYLLAHQAFDLRKL